MSEITSVRVEGRYLDKWEQLITIKQAAAMAGTEDKVVFYHINKRNLSTTFLPGNNRRCKLLVRREWEELISKESK